MKTFMHAFHAEAYALMRIVAGFLFVCHGASKLFAFPMPPPEGIPPMVIYIAGPIELVGGSLVMIGLFAGCASLQCAHGVGVLDRPRHPGAVSHSE